MTSDRDRFPVGLTFAALGVFAVCLALGVWQLQRAAWKQHELSRIAALRGAAPEPIGPVLVRAAHGEDVTFTRVTADCAPAPAEAAGLRETTQNGEWIARARSRCLLASGPYGWIVVDRGFLAASRGDPNPPPITLPGPGRVTGVLFHLTPADVAEPQPRIPQPSSSPLILVAERETPPPTGVAPAPTTANAADNLHYVGAYAPTWFGLAGVVLCVYAAMLWRRRRPQP